VIIKEKNEQNMKEENIQGATASPPGFSATQTSAGGTSPLRSVFRGKWMAWIVLLASLAVTFFAWYLARGEVLERANDRFVFRTKTIESALHARLQACAFLLQSGAGLFAGSEEVTRAEWRTYVTALQIDKHYPGVQGLGFSKRILPAEKKAHIRQVRAEGFPDYDIHPDGERPEYTSIIFLEPFDWRNQRAFGYDMFSEPTRKEAMVMARDTGSPALSGKVTLLQETAEDVQAGFLMYLPVYRKGEVPITPEQRRETLTGYVYSPFRMNDFMQGLLIEKREYVELQIFDGDEPLKEALLYPGGDMDSLISHSGHGHFATCQSILEYAGRRWLLVFTSSPYFEETIDDGQVNRILLLGIIISLLLFSVVLSLTKSRNQALSLAAMTLDLEKSNLGLRREIEERKLAEEKILHLASFPRLNPNPVIELGSAGDVSFLNPAAERMFPELGRMGQSHPLLHGSMELIVDLRQGKKQGEINVESTIGEAIFELHISHVQDINHIRIYAVDITARKEMEEELNRIAYHDQLTGLPNRMLLLDHLNLAINQADRNRLKVALMMLDLDRFKEVNDTRGHHIGDKLLQAVANILTKIFRKGDTVARFGGDEFVLVLPEQTDAKSAMLVAGKILEAFRNPIVLDGHSLTFTSSIGIALYPDHGANIDTILKNADSAMYQAKQTGRNQFQLYVERVTHATD
jgi:diguanylate cyclase (GGDEF)-like protein